MSAQEEHDGRVAECEEESDAERALASGHQPPGRVVDRRDVVGIEGVADAQRVGGDPYADAERSGRTEAVSGRSDERDQDEEADTGEPENHERHQRNHAPFAGTERRSDPTPPHRPAPYYGDVSIAMVRNKHFDSGGNVGVGALSADLPV